MKLLLNLLKQKTSWAGLGLGGILLGMAGVQGELATLVGEAAVGVIAIILFLIDEKKL